MGRKAHRITRKHVYGRVNKLNRYRIYTGPTLVPHVASKLREHGDITVTVEGTEHVYIETAYSREYVLRLLPNWTLRDITLIKHQPAPPTIHHMISGPVSILTPVRNGRIWIEYLDGRKHEVDVTELHIEGDGLRWSVINAAIRKAEEGWDWSKWDTEDWHMQATGRPSRTN